MRIKILVALVWAFVFLGVLFLVARPKDNCQTFGQSMYVEAGTLAKCARDGLPEYVNVRRSDGTYSEFPGELKILMLRYMEFQYRYEHEPEKLSDRDYELYAELQELIGTYNQNDVSFLYGYLNQ